MTARRTAQDDESVQLPHTSRAVRRILRHVGWAASFLCASRSLGPSQMCLVLTWFIGSKFSTAFSVLDMISVAAPSLLSFANPLGVNNSHESLLVDVQ